MAILFSSCNSSKDKTLELSDKMLQTNPERVLFVLDSLENAGGLNEEEQLHLTWNRAMAHQMLGMSLAEDEELPKAIAYYQTEADKQADSYLLEASYLKWTGKGTEAINILDKGIAEITDSTKRVKLMAAQAGLFEHQQEYEKATAVIQHITYNMLDEKYDTTIFTEPTLKGNLGTNVVKTKKHLYDHVLYDSATEKAFAQELDTNNDVAVYVKLPNGFYISTPVGKYNPDWAIAFYEGSVKHIYFVAETKGSMSSLQFREIEKAKIHCAKEHFKAISNGNVVYDVVNGYDELMKILRK